VYIVPELRWSILSMKKYREESISHFLNDIISLGYWWQILCSGPLGVFNPALSFSYFRTTHRHMQITCYFCRSFSVLASIRLCPGLLSSHSVFGGLLPSWCSTWMFHSALGSSQFHCSVDTSSMVLLIK
jgi:hypothetical protein